MSSFFVRKVSCEECMSSAAVQRSSGLCWSLCAAAAASVRLQWSVLTSLTFCLDAIILKWCNLNQRSDERVISLAPLYVSLHNFVFLFSVFRFSLCRLPISHTCFNQICLPPYRTRKELKQKLTIAISNAEGFGLEWLICTHKLPHIHTQTVSSAIWHIFRNASEIREEISLSLWVNTLSNFLMKMDSSMLQICGARDGSFARKTAAEKLQKSFSLCVDSTTPTTQTL